MKPHQRKGSTSNAHVGRDFEQAVFERLSPKIPGLKMPFSLELGHIRLKPHRFDMGSAEERTIVECKSHTWTEGGNMPSAKMTV